MAVYFIREKCYRGKIKIGYSKYPLKRLKDLQTANSNELELVATIDYGTEQIEKEIHFDFFESHIRGEWYNITTKQVEKICQKYSAYNDNTKLEANSYDKEKEQETSYDKKVEANSYDKEQETSYDKKVEANSYDKKVEANSYDKEQEFFYDKEQGVFHDRKVEKIENFFRKFIRYAFYLIPVYFFCMLIYSYLT